MISDATHLLAEIRSRGVSLGTKNGRIWYEPCSALTPDLLDSMREHKDQLLVLLGSPRTPPNSIRSRCPYHIDPVNWFDTPAPRRTGWILTTCRQCGGFIGYRRDHRRKDG
jgi:hypothetical protein